MKANDKQVGGEHYRAHGNKDIQHWDLVTIFGWDYFAAQIIKYVMRWKNKNGVPDLRKAMHFLEKYIEINSPEKLEEQPKSIWDPSLRLDPKGAEGKDGISCNVGRTPRESPPHLKELEHYYLGEVMPTGWNQFVFEGAQTEGYLYTCRECNKHFNAPPHTNPHHFHPCNAIAVSAGPSPIDAEEAQAHGYVDQNGYSY